MSKYSTGELIYYLTRWKETLAVEDDHINAIITRLCAADKLCEAAKKSADEWWRITHEATKNGTEIQAANYDPFISDQVKAIADYEGEK